MQRRAHYEWIDGAKGLCIVLVVLLHASTYTSQQMAPNLWREISVALTPLRMPMFFFLSGLLVAGSVDARRGRTLSRALSLYVVYVVWTVLIGLRFYLDGDHSDDPTPAGLFAIAWSPGQFWYIWALPVYSLIALTLTLFGRRGVYLSLPLALPLSVAAPGLHEALARGLVQPPGTVVWHHVFFYFLWFALGLSLMTAHLRRDIDLERLLADRARPPAALVAAAAAALGLAVVFARSRTEPVWILGFATSAVMVLCGIVLVKALHGSRAAGVLRMLGTNTLRIYVLHQILLFALVIVLIRARIFIGPAAAGVVPPLLAAGLILACLGLGRGLERLGLGPLLTGRFGTGRAGADRRASARGAGQGVTGASRNPHRSVIEPTSP